MVDLRGEMYIRLRCSSSYREDQNGSYYLGGHRHEVFV